MQISSLQNSLLKLNFNSFINMGGKKLFVTLILTLGFMADSMGSVSPSAPTPPPPTPKLSTKINNVTVNANNDGTDDNGAFSVANTANNIVFNAFTDQNGLSVSGLKVFQTFSTSNASAAFCNNCSAPMAAFTGNATVSLVNPAISGTLTLRFRSWVDTDNSGSVDAGEERSDWIEYVITIDADPPVTPKLSTKINNVTVNANNDGTDDNGSFSVCSTTNNITFNLFSDQNGLPGSTKVFQTFTSSNLSHSFCNNCSAPMSAFTGNATISLVNPALSGTLTLRFRSWMDIDNSGSVDAGEERSDWIEYVITVNASPLFSVSPSNIETTAPSYSCSKVVTYSAAASGTPTPDFTYEFSGATTGSGVGTGSGSSFSLGTTTVKLTATNGCGSKDYSFTIKVLDPDMPVSQNTYTGNVTISTQTQMDAFYSTVPGPNNGKKWSKIDGKLTFGWKQRNRPITSLCNLSQLKDVTGTFLIQNFNKSGNPTDLKNLLNLKDLEGELIIKSNPQLINISLPRLAIVWKGIEIKDNSSLKRLDMPKLYNVKLYLRITNNPKAEKMLFFNRYIIYI